MQHGLQNVIAGHCTALVENSLVLLHNESEKDGYGSRLIHMQIFSDGSLTETSTFHPEYTNNHNLKHFNAEDIHTNASNDCLNQFTYYLISKRISSIYYFLHCSNMSIKRTHAI